MINNLKQKCGCTHKKEDHAPLSLQGIYNGNKDEFDGECCVIYRKDENLKCCPCTEFVQSATEGKA